MTSTIRNLIYKSTVFCVEMFRRIKPSFKVHTSEETLLEIIKHHKSIARFGDGEFNLILGRDMKFQSTDSDMANRLSSVLQSSGNSNNCLVAIPRALYRLDGLTFASKKFWLMYSAKNIKALSTLLNSDYEYWDSQISRIYINRADKTRSTKLFSTWKKIWKNQKILIVEGEYSRLGVDNDLFNSAKSIRRILCPPHDAYSVYNDILDEIVNLQGTFDLIVLAIGPTATLMAYDLSNRGFWAIDTGNLDMEYEWKRQSVTKQTAVSGKFTIEAPDGENSQELTDPRYKQQIIKKIQ